MKNGQRTATGYWLLAIGSQHLKLGPCSAQLVTIAALCLCLAFAAGQQYFLGQFPSRSRFAFDPLALAQPSAPQVRDPRQNRGPVVFPPSPPDAIEESSGVVVGASGFGFVPPQQSNTFKRTV
ncbi:GH18664 [Drosophila grimshawi]|uniref:GH18664 n=1 Tax=Drosophila grimshawi TaxID=7222 RepID=B4JH44_DROGR|nr:GH18664 [Drosophila grimshawi]